MPTRIRSTFASIDVTDGGLTLARRLDAGEPVTVQITMTLDPDPRARNDDGTSISFSGDVTDVREI